MLPNFYPNPKVFIFWVFQFWRAIAPTRDNECCSRGTLSTSNTFVFYESTGCGEITILTGGFWRNIGDCGAFWPLSLFLRWIEKRVEGKVVQNDETNFFVNLRKMIRHALQPPRSFFRNGGLVAHFDTSIVRFHYNEFLKIEVEKKCTTQMSCFHKLNCTSQKKLSYLHCDCGINSMRISSYINTAEFVWTRKCPIVTHNIDIWARNLHEIYGAAPLFIMKVMRKCILQSGKKSADERIN